MINVKDQQVQNILVGDRPVIAVYKDNVQIYPNITNRAYSYAYSRAYSFNPYQVENK
ncbi:MAG: hypothetical protein LUE98_11435 [Tannerellaceae bacterium]|nr:hypothetical protein [Tannerellaceae bacterium]